MDLQKFKRRIPLLWALLHPMRITLDGTDNTATVNRNLYRMLHRLGIRDNNHIYSFHLEGDRYGFALLPPYMDASKTVTTSLSYNSELRIFGFELLCPTVQLMLHRWHMDPDSVLHLKVRLHYAPFTDLYYFSIVPPNR